jgi:glucose/arabinose dehydrogenase
LFYYPSNLSAIDLDELNLKNGFKISIFAENLDSPRQMVEGTSGTIFVGERNGQIVALKDSDNNGQADSKIIIANNLSYSTGISLFDGDLYFSEISKIWKIENIEEFFKKAIFITWKCLKKFLLSITYLRIHGMVGNG